MKNTHRGLSVSFLLLSAAFAAAQYQATTICLAGGFSNNGRYQINRGGQVCGMNPATSPFSPFLWTPSSPNGQSGTYKALAVKGSWGQAHALNNNGDVTGTIDYGAVIWPRSGGVVKLGSGVFQTEGEGINDLGEVVMFYADRNNYSGAAVSRVVSGKRKTYLVTSGNAGWPRGINSLAQVIVGGPRNLWIPNAGKTAWSLAATELGDVGDLNDSRAIVGTIEDDGGRSYPAVFLPLAMYSLSPGLTDLFAEVTAAVGPPTFASAWRQGKACAINNAGVIVGVVYHDYNNGNSTELGAWIRTPDGVTVEITAEGWTDIIPNDINDAGQIVATATKVIDGNRYCILLTP